MVQKSFHLLTLLFLTLSLFFILINNINYFTSNLNKDRRNLNSQKQILEGDLERKQTQIRADLNSKIEDRVKSGSIELVGPGNTLPANQLKPSTLELSTSSVQQPPKDDLGQASGITIR